MEDVMTQVPILPAICKGFTDLQKFLVNWHPKKGQILFRTFQQKCVSSLKSASWSKIQSVKNDLDYSLETCRYFRQIVKILS